MFRTWEPLSFAARAGVSWRDITPPLDILARNWGAADRDTAARVESNLLATALAITAGGRTRYLVSADLGWWRNARDVAAVRGRVLADLGCAEEDLLIHLVHTHSGPTLSTAYPDLPGGDLVAPYLERLATLIVDACRQAEQEDTDVTAIFGTGRCAVAVHRDLAVDGRELVAFDPDTPADDTLLVGRFADRTGHTVATLVNYACHPTARGWEPPVISADWVGTASATVRHRTGADCLVLQGASGELSPREQYGDRFLAARVGESIGYAALSTLAAMPEPGTDLALADVVESGATLGRWLPTPATPSTRMETRLLWVDLPARPARGDRFVGLPTTAADERRRRALALRDGYVDGETARHPVWIWRLGDAVIVAQPGEAYSWLQTELRRRHPRLAVFVLNCTNGPGFVYLPPKDTYTRDVYQVWQTELLAGALEILLEAIDGVLA